MSQSLYYKLKKAGKYPYLLLAFFDSSQLINTLDYSLRINDLEIANLIIKNLNFIREVSQ